MWWYLECPWSSRSPTTTRKMPVPSWQRGLLNAERQLQQSIFKLSSMHPQFPYPFITGTFWDSFASPPVVPFSSPTFPSILQFAFQTIKNLICSLDLPFNFLDPWIQHEIVVAFGCHVNTCQGADQRHAVHPPGTRYSNGEHIVAWSLFLGRVLFLLQGFYKRPFCFKLGIEMHKFLARLIDIANFRDECETYNGASYPEPRLWKHWESRYSMSGCGTESAGTMWYSQSERNADGINTLF